MPVYYERTYPFAERTKAKGEEVRQEFDGVAAGLDQVNTDVMRAIKLPFGFDVELAPEAENRAGRVIGFDSLGNPALQQGVGRWRGNYTVPANYAERDIFKDAAGVLGENNIYIVLTAFTSADLSTETAHIEILFNAADAQAFADAAEAAKDAAEAAQLAAETAAGLASDSATTATTQAGSAATQAAASAASAVQSLSAKTHAEEWANKAEDSLISGDAGGNGADDYSARHWSIKSEDSAEASAVSAMNAASSAEAVENERIEWVPGGYDSERIYIYNEAFSHEGSSYIVIATAQGITPPNNTYYDVIASRGPAGEGTGDLLSASNLSDVADAASSRSNLGISATNTPFSNAGTGLSATTVQAAIAESITRLGTAATTNKQTAVTDTTAGRLLVVGAMANLLGFANAGTGLSATTVQAAIAELADDYTAADVLAKLLTVDGAGSGLDADRLDGQDSPFYRNASNLNSGTVPAARLPAASTGAVGVTQLDNSTSSTSTVTAATANAVRIAATMGSNRVGATSARSVNTNYTAGTDGMFITTVTNNSGTTRGVTITINGSFRIRSRTVSGGANGHESCSILVAQGQTYRAEMDPGSSDVGTYWIPLS